MSEKLSSIKREINSAIDITEGIQYMTSMNAPSGYDFHEIRVDLDHLAERLYKASEMLNELNAGDVKS